MKYKFNKNIFRVWGGIFLIILGITLIAYGDYTEVKISCFDTQCTYNASLLENKYIIKSNLEETRPPTFNIKSLNGSSVYGNKEDLLYSGEYIIYSNYEKKPYLIKNFLSVLFASLLGCLLFNHLLYNHEVKD